MDDNDKSSGVFDSNGLLSKQDIKVLRKMLRETKSCIWDMVISFEELFGKEHLFHFEQAIGLLNNILPKFFKSANSVITFKRPIVRISKFAIRSYYVNVDNVGK